jgi:AcrR family transcriptional regulator
MNHSAGHPWQEAVYDEKEEALVQALLDLIDEGELLPYSKTVAARAGVTQRTLFNHFGAMEALYREAMKPRPDGRRLVMHVDRPMTTEKVEALFEGHGRLAGRTAAGAKGARGYTPAGSGRDGLQYLGPVPVRAGWHEPDVENNDAGFAVDQRRTGTLNGF